MTLELLPVPAARAGLELAPTRVPRVLVGGVLVALVVGLFWWGVPALTGSTWGAVAALLVSTSPGALVALGLVWVAGLAVHTITLAAALPGLTHRRAMLLSLTGSAVANVLPLGGAAGVALNHRMTARWGFATSSFASYTVVTNLWDVLAKLALPVLLLPLVGHGLPVAPREEHGVVACAVLLPLAAVVLATLVAGPRSAGRSRGRLGSTLEQVRGLASGVIRTAWSRLTVGMAGYTGLLLVLLLGCLTVTGASVAVPVVLVAFCFERLATLVGLLPGGLGLVEVGLSAVLLAAPGASPAGVLAGILLYRAFTFLLEIPVGGLLLAGWWWRGRSVR